MATTKIIMDINPDEAPHLRIGLRWEARDIDFTKFIDGGAYSMDKIKKEVRAGFLFVTTAGVSAIFSGAGSLLRKWNPAFSERLEVSASDLKKIERLQSAYLRDQNKPPFNLDLICFCYDKNKKLVEMVSPFTPIPRNADKARLSIVHSGDELDGVGVYDDEEILIEIKDVPNTVDHMFFVVASHNWAFDQVKEGRCHIVRTKDETELVSIDLTGDGKKETFIFAKLQRAGSKWRLQEISDYIDVDQDNKASPDDAIDDVIREKY
jgi:tellurium resistance protein TerD